MIPEDTPTPEDMDVEPTPLDEDDIMDEETMDELLRSPRDRPTQSSPSTATAKELRALHASTPKRDLPDESQSLASTTKKNKVTGKGVAILEKISNYLFDEDKMDENERVGLLQVRLAAPRKKKTPARTPPKPKDNENNLSYNACLPDIQAKLRQCRAKEWQKWKEFNAGVILSKAELQELLDDGVKVNPMQWVETNKNGFKRRHDKSTPS